MNEEFQAHLLSMEKKLWTNNAVFYKDNLTEDRLLVFPETGVITRDIAVDAILKENEEGRRWAEVYTVMLKHSNVATCRPVQDFERAR